MFDYRSLFDLTGRVALVVGAGSGIGRAAAEGLASHGATVYCADLNRDAVAAAAAEISDAGLHAVAAPLDMTDAAAVDALVQRIVDEAGALDVLVTTPSINVRKPLIDLSEEEFDRVVNLNLKGTFFLLRAAGRRMAEQGRGSIVAFASIRAEVVEPGQGVYAATKAGTRQMVRALAAELAPAGVRVNAIAPGVVETPLTAQIKAQPTWYGAYAQRSALGRWAQPHEMVGPLLLLASDAGSYITGSLLFVDGGWTAIDGRFAPPL